MALRHTQIEKIEVLALSEKGLKPNQIAKMLGLVPNTVRRWINDPSKPVSNENHWSEEESSLLIKHYPKSEIETICQLFPDRKFMCIENKARRLGLYRDTHRKSRIDFSCVDCEEKAYILGFIAADGHMSERGGRLTLLITLARKDQNHLTKLKDTICPEATLSFHGHTLNGKEYEAVRFSISDQKLCGDLVNLGIVPRKTLILKAPNILPHLIPHYVRGYFDGDGSVALCSGSKQVECTICGTENILGFINNHFKEYYEHKCNVRAIKGKKAYLLHFGSKTAMHFLQYIYKDATFYLDRKHQKARPFLRAMT